MSRLNHGLLVLFIISGWSAFFPSVTPFTAPIQAAPTVQSDTGIAPPPLPRSCIRGGTPIDDYDRAACCVSGYVYLNGVPIAGAEVVLEVAGRQTTVSTTAPAPGEHASFSVNLSDAPLRAQPGDTVTMTASAGGQTRTTSFVVQPGGQQIDIALPQSAVDATWEVGEATLPARHSHALASDLRRQRVVLFGGMSSGVNGTGLLQDTWEWDGSFWQKQRVSNPPVARQAHAMAFDEQRGRVVLFGGRSIEGSLADTWEWDGNTWQLRNPARAPEARYNHTMAYDPISRRTFLFGGVGIEGPLNDTWVWDGTTWEELDPTTQPPLGSNYSLAYYSETNRLTLVSTPRHSSAGHPAQTWEWDGETWLLRFPANSPRAGTFSLIHDAWNKRLLLVGVQLSSSAPRYMDVWAWDGTAWEAIPTALHMRWDAVAAYDVARAEVILVGGSLPDMFSSLTYKGLTNETWSFDSYAWAQVFPRHSPTWRVRHGLAYDAARRHTLLFGGSSGAGELWSWNGTVWSQLRPALMPSVRTSHMMAYDKRRQVLVLFGGRVNLQHNNETWEWDGLTWTKRAPLIAPPARSGAAMVYDERRQVMVLFGGAGADGVLTDTWEWDGEQWTQRTPEISPTGMQSTHTMVYDAAQSETILFGSSGMWTYDGTTWTQRITSPMPQYRQHTGLAYNPLSQRVILFGGNTGSTTGRNDTWEWDGSTWQQKTPMHTPPSRYEHEMAFDESRGQAVLFGGFVNSSGRSNDTWEWDGTDWYYHPDDSDKPQSWPYSALDYTQNGRSLLFGGRNGTTFDPNTYEWQGNQWRQLTPLHSPSAREGARIARNSDGSDLLLFGGRAADGSYRADTWAWRDDDWFAMAPPVAPSARGFYGLTFDTQREVWVLFGGQDSARYLNDTWEFDGTIWTRREVTVSPPPRANATLTYDEQRNRTVLIGGQNTDGVLDDVWEWDGAAWRDVTPVERLSGRTGHGAAYDSVNGAVVVAGGADASGAALPDTWEWNGRSWTQRLVAQPMPARAFFAMAYDGQRGEIIAFGGLNGSTPVNGTYLHQVLGAVANPLPIATIVQATPRDARQGIDTMTFIGRGADADATDEITAYRWTHNGVVIGTEPTLIIDPASLPLGQQTISFAVRDNEGAWSQSVLQPVIIRDRDGRTATGASWSFLIYAVGDNDLDLWMGNYAATNGMLYRLSRAGAQPNVHVSILYDGPKSDDTWLYTLDEAGLWSRNRWQGAVEARMDEQATLAAFLTWGQNTYRTDHYALALIDHANGVIGFGQDKTSDSTGQAFLTPAEIRGALQEALDDGARRLDIVLYDGCSFGLLENASIVEGLAHFVVASPNTGWGVFPYEHYRKLIGTVSDPQGLATAIASTYATRVAAARLPYTISVFDLAAFAPVQTAFSNLGDSLLTYIAGDRETRIAQLRTIRLLAQKYDSGGGQLFIIDPEDSYLDAIDFARQLTLAIDDPLVDAAAVEVIRSAEEMIIFTQSRSGSFVARGSAMVMGIDLNRAHGMGIYYPPRLTTDSRSAYVRYINNEQFTITRNWGWSRFLAAGLPALSAGDPLPMSNDSLIVPLITADVEARAGDARTILTASSGGTVSAPDGAAQAAFLSGSVTEDTLIELLDSVALPNPLPMGDTALRVIRLNASTMNMTPVLQSRVPFRLTMTAPNHPSRALMSAQEQRTYTVLGWNDGQWVTLFPCDWCMLDMETRSVSILSDRFTTFVLVERINNTDANWRLYLPQLQRSVHESAALTPIGAR